MKLETAKIFESRKVFKHLAHGAAFLISLLLIASPQSGQTTVGVWSKHLGQMNWDAAVQSCAGIGMRLPSLVELGKAYSSGATKRWEEQGAHWSSKEVLSNDTRAFVFWTGEWPGDGIVGENSKRIDNLVKTRRFYVRCFKE
ncbi:MAG: hypothetical protein JNM27_11315 [Leptospirales bacterium]|nr:hypothetical protein [Leptospirales bacterium]